ncbi:MAG: SH3 domain-containing protein [Lachnospiraceae bacterium]|nr:SH3 domain-containing protein [Lachnospiraceae bacterium]
MKKTTINAILIAIITIMSVSICFLIFCIMTRPRYVIINEPETAAMITEVSDLSEEPQQQSTPPASNNDIETPVPEPPAGTMHGKTSTRVNIRDAASENAKVLSTVDEGTTFDIIEILDNGWTKILYEGSEAYISSNFVIITNE